MHSWKPNHQPLMNLDLLFSPYALQPRLDHGTSFRISAFCVGPQISMKNITCWWLSPTPLKNDGVRQLGLLFPRYAKIKKMFQTAKQISSQITSAIALWNLAVLQCLAYIPSRSRCFLRNFKIESQMNMDHPYLHEPRADSAAPGCMRHRMYAEIAINSALSTARAFAFSVCGLSALEAQWCIFCWT